MSQNATAEQSSQLVLTCTQETDRLVVRVREDTDMETLDAVARSLTDFLGAAEARAEGSH